MGIWGIVGMKIYMEKPSYSMGRKPYNILSITCLLQADLVPNPGFCREKPATNMNCMLVVAQLLGFADQCTCLNSYATHRVFSNLFLLHFHG